MPNPSRDEIKAELLRRGIDPDAMQQPQNAPMTPNAANESVMPDQMQESLAAQAEANAMQAPQPISPTVTNTTFMQPTPEDLTRAQFGKPDKTKKSERPKPSVYDYNGRNIDVSNYPEFESVKQTSEMSTLQNKTTNVLKEIKAAQEKLKKIKEIDEKLKISQGDPYVGAMMNKARDFMSYYGIGKADRDDSRERQLLEADLARLRVNADAALKGGGALGERMYKQFEQMGIHPTLSQGLDVTEDKLKALEKMLTTTKVGTQMSLKTGRAIPFDEVEQLVTKAYVNEFKAKNQQFKDVPDEEVAKILQEEGVIE